MPMQQKDPGEQQPWYYRVVPEYSGFSSGKDNTPQPWTNGQHSAGDIFKRIHFSVLQFDLNFTYVCYWVSNGLGDGWVAKTQSSHYLKQRWSSSLTQIFVLCILLLLLFCFCLAGHRWEAMNNCHCPTTNYTAGVSITVGTPYSTIPYTTIFYITRWTHGPQNLQRPIRTLIVLLGFGIKQIFM